MKGKGVNPFELTPCWTLGGADRIRTGDLHIEKSEREN